MFTFPTYPTPRFHFLAARPDCALVFSFSMFSPVPSFLPSILSGPESAFAVRPRRRDDEGMAEPGE